MLPSAVQGSKKPSVLITWTDRDGNAIDLTGATVTARITNVFSGATVDSDGQFLLDVAAEGKFMWLYGDNDISNYGRYSVQFTATYTDGLTPAKSIIQDWVVHKSI